MEANQYASMTPLDSDHLIEKVAEYQREIDACQADLDDLADKVKAKKADMKRWHSKIALIGRSQEAGTPIYQLDGGELTDEEPNREDTLPFAGGDVPHEDTEVPQDEAPSEVETVVDLGDGHPEAPAEAEEPAEEVLTDL